MIITPPSRPPRQRPVALLTPGYRALKIENSNGQVEVHGSQRIYNALVKLEGFTLYSTGSLAHFRHTTGAHAWQAQLWRGRTTSMSLDGTKVKILGLRSSLDGSTDAFKDLCGALGWLGNHGVGAASISSMGWALWRSTLTEEVKIASDPRIGRGALYGGRQAVREPRSYSHMVAADITSAYPFSMAANTYAMGLRKVANTTRIVPDVPGICQGWISVDTDMPYGPVPYRLAKDLIAFPSGTVEGSWTWAEAAAAQDLGCTLHVEQCWAPTKEATLFARWWELVKVGRRLPGKAATLIKACANSLWGLFAMTGDDTELLRWEDEAGLRPIRVPLAPRKLPHAGTAHIAAETSSRVRVRMLLEGCYGIGQNRSAGHPVHIDTDGIIIRKSAVAGMRKDPEPGEWRQKTAMRKVDIRAPQVYRYTCGSGCGIGHRRWHYSVSGVGPEAAEGLFNGSATTLVSLGLNNSDMVLPSFNVHDAAERERVVKSAGGLGR
jgi:hypothetical protein